VRPFKLLRIAATTVAATAVGLFHLATRREKGARIILKPGDLAPDFEFAGSDGRTHRLGDSRGREAVVLAWLPKAFTGGCTAECESLGRSSQTLRRFAAKYVGASADRATINRDFARSLGIDYPILSDPSRTVARAYGVLGGSGFPKRWTFYISADGRILEIDKHVRVSSHGDDVAARLDALNIPRRT
jgi:thioredoxin-dependent peroxiredoxin